MKTHTLLPKGIPLPEVIRREEEWIPPEPMDSDAFDKITTIFIIASLAVYLFLFFTTIAVEPLAALVFTVLFLISLILTDVISIRKGKKIEPFRVSVLVFIFLALGEFAICVITACDVVSYEDEAAARPVWLTLQAVMFMPVFIFTVCRPFSVLSALLVRRMRCSKQTGAVFKGQGHAGISAYQAGHKGYVGAAHYHYECEDAVYVAVYSDELSVMYPRGSYTTIRIDPDYPEYYYDKQTAKKLRSRFNTQLVIGLLMAAAEVLNVAIFGFNYFDF